MPSPPPVPIQSAVLLARRIAALVTRRRLGVAVSLGARGLEAAAKFGLYALAARVLGGADAGRFFLALSVIQIVSTIARLGLERPLTRHVAAELAVGDGPAAARAALTGCCAVAGASIVAALGLAASASWFAGPVFGPAEMGWVLALAALTIPVQNLAFVLAHVLIGLERGASAQMVMNALAPALTLAALILGADDLRGLLSAYAAAFAISAALGLGLILFDRGWRTRPAVDTPHASLPSLWQGAAPHWLVDVSQAALISIPVLGLGVFASPAAVSVFSICSRLSMLVTTVVLSLGALSAPAFARHHRLGDWSALREAVVANRRTTILFCAPLVAVMALGGGRLLALLGVPATDGLPVLLILLVGQLVFCMLPSRDLVLAMAGQGRVLRRLSLWQLAFCTALCLLLIPPFGAIGAALGSATIWIGGAVALAVAARRRLPQLAL